jgi:hypothetical protein
MNKLDKALVDELEKAKTAKGKRAKGKASKRQRREVGRRLEVVSKALDSLCAEIDVLTLEVKHGPYPRHRRGKSRETSAA